MSQRIVLTGAIVVALFVLSAWLLWDRTRRPDDIPQVGPPSAEAGAAKPGTKAMIVRSEDASSHGAIQSKNPRPESPAQPATAETATAPAAAESGQRFKRTTAGGLNPKEHGEAHPKQPPLFKDWNEAPRTAIVISGEQHGYVEPCGCSLNQMGGLSRRADLFRQIRERGWPVTAFDLGGLVNYPTRRQAKIKLGMALAVLKELEYAGVALGVEELQTGVDLLQYGEADRPPFLSANLVLFGSPEIGLHVPKAIVMAGDLKIGVTAIFGEEYQVKVVPPGGNGGQPADVDVLEPVAALKKIVAELEAERPDLMVLLSHAPVEETKAIAVQFPQFALVVSAGGPEDMDPRPKHIGQALLVTPGQKGKNIAVVGVFDGNEGLQLRMEAVALDGDRFRETPRIHEHMRRYQEALAVQNLVVDEPAIEDPRNATLTVSNEYVGAKVCGECHTKAYAKWQETGHARATESLKAGRDGQEATWISRMDDPECIACHVTGWQTKDGYFRYKSGYQSEQATPHLVGQQCENCHGPGGRHTEFEREFAREGKLTDELTQFREFIQLPLDEAGVKACVKCHDGDNDPHFKTDGDVFDRYWQEVKHSWRD